MKSKEPIIINCNITSYPRPMPEEMYDQMPEVKVRFDTGEEKVLFEFYPDEIDFKESEFIGLSEQESRYLKFEKDKRYLQS